MPIHEKSLEQKKPIKISRNISHSLVRILSHIRLCQDEEHRAALEEFRESTRLEIKEV